MLPPYDFSQELHVNKPFQGDESVFLCVWVCVLISIFLSFYAPRTSVHLYIPSKTTPPLTRMHCTNQLLSYFLLIEPLCLPECFPSTTFILYSCSGVEEWRCMPPTFTSAEGGYYFCSSPPNASSLFKTHVQWH